MRKSFSEYTKEKIGASLETLGFAEKCSKFFTFDKLEEEAGKVKFIGVTMNEDVAISKTRKLEKGSEFHTIEFTTQGYMNVYESEADMLTYTVMQNPLIAIPTYSGATEFSAPSNNLTVVQQDCVIQIQNIVNAVKQLTIADAQSLKAILGPTVEERILRSVIDCVIFDNPQASGVGNGV